jgi:glycosyltransferase involved in cell wall biosynthesis
MRLVLVGDGESPHLVKWARALAPEVELWAVSSRGFAPAFDGLVPEPRRLALGTRPRVEGGNFGLLWQLPRLARWLRRVRADWIHAHYLSSHGTLAWLATRWLGVPGRLVGSAWGSDILLAPRRSALLRAVTRRVLRGCVLATSDSQVMAGRMREFGAGEVMVFPFGLEALPATAGTKDDGLFFANRALEPLYRPQRVLQVFAAVARAWPQARLVVANDGSLRAALEDQARAPGLTGRVRFVGRLAADAQAACYDEARWYLSLPASDSVAVSVLEAMAHGCVPLLSDLPANRELVRDGDNGLIVSDGDGDGDGDDVALVRRLEALGPRAAAIAEANRAWVGEHALFPASVERFLVRLRALQAS